MHRDRMREIAWGNSKLSKPLMEKILKEARKGLITLTVKKLSKSELSGLTIFGYTTKKIGNCYQISW